MQDDEELVAAHAARHIDILARLLLQDARDNLERPVALVVAVRIVDALEIVDVHHQHRQRPLLALRFLHHLRERLVRRAAVKKPRQQVVPREAAIAFICLLELADRLLDEIHEMAHDGRARIDMRNAPRQLDRHLARRALAHADRHERHVRREDPVPGAQELAIGIKAR